MPSNFLQIYCGLSVWHLWSPWNSVQVSVQELEEFLKTAWRATGQLDGASSSHLQGSPSQGWFLSPKKNESESGEWKSWLKAQHSKNKDHGIQSHHFMGNRWGNSGNSVRLFFWTPKSLQMVTAAMKLKYAYSLEEKLWHKIAYWKAETLLCQQRSV